MKLELYRAPSFTVCNLESYLVYLSPYFHLVFFVCINEIIYDIPVLKRYDKVFKNLLCLTLATRLVIIWQMS